MSDYAQAANTRRYNVNKKWQKFSRGYTTQIKTNFKKITVKNDWA